MSGASKPTSSPSSSSSRLGSHNSFAMSALQTSIGDLEKELEGKRNSLKIATERAARSISPSLRISTQAAKRQPVVPLTVDGHTPWRPGNARPKIFHKGAVESLSREVQHVSPRKAPVPVLREKKVLPSAGKNGDKKLRSKNGNEIRFSPNIFTAFRNLKKVEFDAAKILAGLVAKERTKSLSSSRYSEIKSGTCPRTPPYANTSCNSSNFRSLSKTI